MAVEYWASENVTPEYGSAICLSKAKLVFRRYYLPRLICDTLKSELIRVINAWNVNR